MQKIIDLCKKLNALAKGGVGGEKHNAAQMLQKLLEKHAISINDIEEEVKKRFCFKPKNSQLLVQVAATVIGTVNAYTLRGRKGVYMDLTTAQYIEIEAKYSFYQSAYNKELKKMVKAFVMKNKLYADRPEGMEQKPLTDKELAELWDIAQMAQGLDRHHYNKQIAN